MQISDNSVQEESTLRLTIDEPSFQTSVPSYLAPAFAHILQTDGAHPSRSLVGDVGDQTLPEQIWMRSNDYLSLGSHPEVIAAKAGHLLSDGHNESVSRVFQGSAGPLVDFERRMASWLGAEAALLTNSGWLANVALLKALGQTPYNAYIDKQAHASLHAGIAGTKAKRHGIAHNSCEDLEAKITQHGPGLVIVDALYSHDGSVCPLLAFMRIVKKTGSSMLVDESHSFACASGGKDICSELGMADDVLFRTISLSKGLPGRGGVILGPARVLEVIRWSDPEMVFSTQMGAYEVAGWSTGLDILQREQWRIHALSQKFDKAKSGLLNLGYDVSACARQILAVTTGTDEVTRAFRDALTARGLWGAVFSPPATPKNQNHIRFSINVKHTDQEIEKFLSVMQEVKPILEVRMSRM